MECPKCQHENAVEARFYEECAAPLMRACANCGAQASFTANYCRQCGQYLPRAATNSYLASPQSYTPQHLANRILTSRAILEGERKQVTMHANESPPGRSALG
jgi:double zinc ribbon protein